MKTSYYSIDNLFSKLTESACQQGKEYLSSMPRKVDTLVDACRRWPEYLYEQSEFAISLLRKYLGLHDLQFLTKHALYIDYQDEIKNAKLSRIFFLGKSKCSINIADYAVSTLYLFNESDVIIYPGSHSIIAVEAHDNSRLRIEKGENAVVNAYKYDNSIITGKARCIKSKR